MSSKEKMEQNMTHCVLKRLQRLFCPIFLFHTKEIGAYRGLVTCPMSPNDLMAHPGVESSLLFNKPIFLCCYDS